MKIQHLYIIVLILTSVSILSCKKQIASTTDNDIVFDTIHSVKNYYVNNDSTQPSCNIKMTFIYPKSYANEAILDSMKRIFISTFLDDHYELLKPADAVAGYEKAYIENYKEDVNTYLKDRDLSEEHDDNENYFSFYEAISNDIVFNKSEILSFVVKQTTYKGGATSYEFLKNKSISLSSGKVINEDDIFNPGFEKVLSPIFKDYLFKQNKVQNINDLENLGYFGIEEMMPNNNFYINNKGVNYTFNKGENSAYKLDAINIFIPYKELSLVLKENSPVSQFIEK